MSFYSMYRIFKDIFKTIFGYKFWRKLLICIIIGVILFFVLHNYGYCAEPPDTSYNEIEPIGILQDVVVSGRGQLLSYSNTKTYVFKLDSAMTYVLCTPSSGATNIHNMTIMVSNEALDIGDTGTFITRIENTGELTYNFYNDTYMFMYVSLSSPQAYVINAYQQVYSTYLEPLVTPVNMLIGQNGEVTNTGNNSYYLYNFQINKGFNYKISGIDSNTALYYTSELLQLDVANTAISYYSIGSTGVDSTPMHNLFIRGDIYNTTGAFDSSLYYEYGYNTITSETIINSSVSNRQNLNVLPFYKEVSSGEEFTAPYTGWLYFVDDTDLLSSMEIWTDYNFYDHDTIYIDNRIQNVNSSVQQGTSEINQSVQDMSNTISDNLTNTNYNQGDVSVNTSTIDNVPDTTDGIFTTIFNNFNNAVSGGVSELVIPLPHNSGSITITSDIVSSHLGNLTLLVNAFWMYLFGIYAFRFVNNLIHSIKNGDILNGFNSSNEVITNTMV